MLYDDSECCLRDQGLEVVAIPYVPSPSSRRARARKPRPPAAGGGPPAGLPRSPSGGARGRTPPRGGGGRRDDGGGVNALVDADVDDSENDNDMPDGGGDGGSPGPGGRDLFTPRTQVAVAEAVNQPQHEAQSSGHRCDGGGLEDGQRRPAVVTGVKTGRSTPPPRRMHSEPARGGGEDPAALTRSETRRDRSPPRNNEGDRHARSRSSPAKPARSRRPTYLELARAGYQELVNAIIRPPRSKYPLEALGPDEFVFCGADFERRDFGVVNERGLVLECSMWRRKDDDEHDGVDETCDASRGDGREGGYGSADGARADSCPTRMTLNVDDWDESRERGQMYLHVPDGFDGADDGLSLSSSSGEDDDDDDDERGEEGGNDNVDRSGESHSNYYSGCAVMDEEMMSPRKNGRRTRRDPVVVYLHGNSSARTEVIPQLGHLLSLGVSVVSFDFAGSGRSEGDLVSLGYFEREDLQSVVHHLRRSGEVGPVALWGRSMGSATALMYGSRDPTISGMVLDSCFTDLRRLAEEMVARGKEQGVNVPGFVVTVALKMIKNSIKAQAGFNIKRLCPAEHAGRCFVPAMFVAGDHDDFIGRHHSEALHERYAGDKNIMVSLHFPA